jgi:septal ring factor EnvC (AmiA/AmiB activator)
MLNAAMKNRIALVIGVLVCLGLIIALVSVTKQERADTETIQTLTNNLAATNMKLDEQKKVATVLEKDLDEQKRANADLTNQFTRVSADLSTASASLAKTEVSLKESQAKVALDEAKINELEAQNQALDKQALDLSTSITNLTGQIASTEKKLAAAEGDKEFLQKELKRMMAEKAELERQFNDLTVLRAQVSRLKEELTISRRLEWIRQGIFAANEQKGAQKLMQGLVAPQTVAKVTPKPAYDLNVEVSADGSVRVIPPMTTNAPASAVPGAK